MLLHDCWRGVGSKRVTVTEKRDDVGYHTAVNRVSVHNLHIAILHQLGIDYHQRGFAHEGREERLTDPQVTGGSVGFGWNLRLLAKAIFYVRG